MNKPYTIVVKNLDGWWSAVCTELNVSGFGPTQDEAVKSVARSIRSTLAAQASMLQRDDSQIHTVADVQFAH